MKNDFRVRHCVPVLVLTALMLPCLPASAQVDFSGEWSPRFYEDAPERGPGPELADYLGIPINDAARMRGDTWEASQQTLPEWQCRPHGGFYIWRGPSQLRISKEVDPVTRTITAFHAEWLRSVDNAIFLDGRPHPSQNAPHTWGGFATGKWEGDMTTIIRDRIQDMIKKGMTLEQVKAAKPTRDYDPRYGATTGFWTTDKFVEAVYRSLGSKK